MDRNPAHLSDILESAKLAIKYLAEFSFEDFQENTVIQDAVIRRIELIGEASSRVSSDFKSKYPQLPWNEMKGMRNLLIHEYDEINLEQVWQTLKNDLPLLISTIQQFV